ncbi:hypothetical protein [Mesorhizobium sp. YR577]|uniref:hypothetical protein n=1 Tax=Mesorhizobium sp. YR577 TaxID=1884373 RepID=UPI0008E9E72B|nr:hypothetical protein [Mesorhizobium sp. YR577]SFT41470.1 hypothetical protein SAMN05518861_101156 [Mesorhizobium sp. YR577]
MAARINLATGVVSLMLLSVVEAGAQTKGIETNGSISRSRSSSSSAVNPQLLNLGASIIIQGLSNSENDNDAAAERKQREVERELEFYRSEELRAKNGADALTKANAAAAGTNPFGKPKKKRNQEPEGAGPANAADCLSIEDRYFFRNNCDYKVMFTFRTLGGGCFQKNYGTDTVGARRRVATAVTQKCGGTRGKQIEYVACEYNAWTKNACRLTFAK